MGTAERLYEIACEARDTEQKYDRLVLELEQLHAVRRAALELTDALEFVDLPEKANKARYALLNLAH